jgi:uncharacterized protein
MQCYFWKHSGRFNDFQTLFQAKFPGMKLQKISVDAGFTCPNRDGTLGKGGCTYCNNASFTPYFETSKSSVSDQLQKGIRFFSHKYPEMNYLAFFQSYSNTYAPLPILKRLYEEALNFPGVRGLVISTRPDCVNSENLDYLAKLSLQHYIMLEFGLESHLDRTLESLHRRHTVADSETAIRETARRSIPVTAHLILGLPGETRKDWYEQAGFISRLPVNNLKLHQLQIHKGTVMAHQFMKNPGNFPLFTEDEYADLCVEYLELLNPQITVERFTSQAPPGLLIAPGWGIKNHAFTAKIRRLLEEHRTWQGRLFNTDCNND